MLDGPQQVHPTHSPECNACSARHTSSRPDAAAAAGAGSAARAGACCAQAKRDACRRWWSERSSCCQAAGPACRGGVLALCCCGAAVAVVVVVPELAPEMRGSGRGAAPCGWHSAAGSAAHASTTAASACHCSSASPLVLPAHVRQECESRAQLGGGRAQRCSKQATQGHQACWQEVSRMATTNAQQLHVVAPPTFSRQPACVQSPPGVLRQRRMQRVQAGTRQGACGCKPQRHACLPAARQPQRDTVADGVLRERQGEWSGVETLPTVTKSNRMSCGRFASQTSSVHPAIDLHASWPERPRRGTHRQPTRLHQRPPARHRTGGQPPSRTRHQPPSSTSYFNQLYYPASLTVNQPPEVTQAATDLQVGDARRRRLQRLCQGANAGQEVGGPAGGLVLRRRRQHQFAVVGLAARAYCGCRGGGQQGSGIRWVPLASSSAICAVQVTSSGLVAG